MERRNESRQLSDHHAGQPAGGPSHSIAQTRGLAGDEHPPARGEDAIQLPESRLRIRKVVQDGVPHHEIEEPIRIRQVLGICHAQADVTADGPS